MKRSMMVALGGAAALAASSVMAAEIAPGDVNFVDGAVAELLSGQAGDPAAGRKVFGSRAAGNCVACHAVTSLTEVQWHGEIGPVLDGVAGRWDEAQLRGIVANAKMMFDGTMMPSFYKVDGFIRPGDAFTGNAATEIAPLLSAQQVEDVVAYLMTLKE